jgi:hypothetical protein
MDPVHDGGAVGSHPPKPTGQPVLIERFLGTTEADKRHVWFLGEVFVKHVHHYQRGQSVPCLRTRDDEPAEACPYCPLTITHSKGRDGKTYTDHWRRQREGYVAAYVLRKGRKKQWVPAVVVLTNRLIELLEADEHVSTHYPQLRGFRMNFWRVKFGNNTRPVYEVPEEFLVNPGRAGFDPVPFMQRLWNNTSAVVLPQLPEALEYLPPVLQAKTVPLTEAQTFQHQWIAKRIKELEAENLPWSLEQLTAEFNLDQARVKALLANRNKRDLGHDQPENGSGAGSGPEIAAIATPGAAAGIPATPPEPKPELVSPKTADQPNPPVTSSKDQTDVFSMSLKSMEISEIEAFIRVTPRLPGFAALVDAARAEIESRPKATPPSDIQMSPTPPTPKATPRSDSRTSLDAPEPLDTDAILLKFGTGKIVCDEVGAALPNGHPSKPVKGKGGRS